MSWRRRKTQVTPGSGSSNGAARMASIPDAHSIYKCISSGLSQSCVHVPDSHCDGEQGSCDLRGGDVHVQGHIDGLTGAEADA